MSAATLRCPACRARFRSTRHCSRCGADLAPLLLLLARSRRLGAEAQAALGAADFAEAQRLSSAAELLCSTRSGQALSRLAGWLRRVDPAITE